MFKKAQGLPMTTIVLILISLLVLVTVAIFFFGQMGQTSGGATESQCIAKCQSLGAYYAQPNVDFTESDGALTSFCSSCPDKRCSFSANDGGQVVSKTLICSGTSVTPFPED